MAKQNKKSYNNRNVYGDKLDENDIKRYEDIYKEFNVIRLIYLYH